MVRALGVRIDEVRLIGGGARSPLWRQMMADIMGSEIIILEGGEGPAQGAAILAGKGVGVYDDLKEATDRLLPVAERIEPDADSHRRYSDIYGLFHALYPALKQHYRIAHTLVKE